MSTRRRTSHFLLAQETGPGGKYALLATANISGIFWCGWDCFGMVCVGFMCVVFVLFDIYYTFKKWNTTDPDEDVLDP